MHVLKTGLNANKFATFGCFRKGFITLRVANDPYSGQKPLNASTLAGFRNT